MLLTFEDKQLQKIKKKEVYFEQKQSWQRNLKLKLYKQNFQNINIKKGDEQSIRIISRDMNRLGRKIHISLQGKQTKDDTFTCEDQIRQYPHGFYAFYVPIRQSCEFQDEVMLAFSYFKILEEKGMQSQKLLCYQQIGNCLGRQEEHIKLKDRALKNEHLRKRWRICLKKYICPLDSITKTEIYYQTLKKGMQQIKRYHEDLKLQCLIHVFYMHIFRIDKFFQFKGNMLNIRSSVFSVGPTDQINEITMGRTLKMLFCPICDIYDCGIHDDDITNPLQMHHFVNPNNLIEMEDRIESALNLLQFFKKLLMTKDSDFDNQEDQKMVMQDRQDFCSEVNCFKSFKNWKIFSDFRKKNQYKSKLTPLIRIIIDMGIHIFLYNPCKLWGFAKFQDNKIGITCGLIFLYLAQEYNLIKKLQLKLSKDEISYLKMQKQGIISDLDGITLKQKHKKQTVKQIDASFFYNSKISVCYHYFLNGESIDEDCNNCLCRKRGFCRKDCMCSVNCKLKIGCDCTKKSECLVNRCFCFQNSRQCEPGICHNCFTTDSQVKMNKCKNQAVLTGQNCLLRVGLSRLKGAGLGIFAGQHIKNKQYICTYAGEIIQNHLQYIRETQSQTNDFYNFGNHNGTIDSRFLGNKSRFINHGNEGEENVTTQVKMCNGTHVIVLIAKKDIQLGEELLFNYDGNGQLFKNHKQKYPFIKSRD